MIKERRGMSWWEHVWECKNMHQERSRSAFEQGGKRWGWCEGLILKLGQPQRKRDIWISAAITFHISKSRLFRDVDCQHSIQIFQHVMTTTAEYESMWSTVLLYECINFQKPMVWMVTTRQKLVFFSHHVFSPKPFQKTSTGEGTLHCLVIWKSPDQPHPHPLGVCEESHCGPNTVLILLLRGVRGTKR